MRSGCHGALVRVIIAGMNTMTKKQPREERVYPADTSTILFIIKGSQERGTQTGQRDLKAAAY